MNRSGLLVIACLALAACGDDEGTGGGGGGTSASTTTGTSSAATNGSTKASGTSSTTAATTSSTGGNGASASADLNGPDGISGTVTFTQVGTQVTFVVSVTGVTPTGSHAVHIHENPDCSGDFSAAGNHWNPTNAANHGVFDQGGHLGDIGDIPVMADGTGTYTVTTDLWSVAAAGEDVMKNVVGHSIIVHEMSNENPGPRMACGVVELD